VAGSQSTRPTAPTSDIGSTDLYWGTWGQGLLTDWWETTADLIWPQSVITFGRMRHDPQLRAVLNAYFLPILRATWVLDPEGCRDEVVQHCADGLGVGILGTDLIPGPARRRGVIWTRHLREALNHLVYGHMPFEFRYVYDEKTKLFQLDNLGQRSPWTLAQIHLNTDSSIREVVQTTQAKPLPADRLLWYVNQHEGANWAGISMLRPAFGAWLLKHETWRTHATSIRRFGMGVPTVTAPPGATGAQVQEATNLASGFRAGDQSGVGMPQGFKFELSGMTGSVPDALGFIRYLDQAMAKMVLTQLIELGTTDTGNRALGETFLDLFLLSLQGVADEISTTATSGHPGSLPGILTNMVDVNWGPDEPAPRMVCTDVGENYEVTAESLEFLTRYGALSPDESLDDWIRDRWRLPERIGDWQPTSRGIPASGQPGGNYLPAGATPTPQAPGANVGGVGDTGSTDLHPTWTPPTPPTPAAPKPPVDQPTPNVPQPGEPKASRRHRHVTARTGLRRQLTPVEAASGYDPLMVQREFTDALDRLLTGYRSVVRAQRQAIVDQVIAAVETGRSDKLAALTVDSGPGATLIRQAMDAHAQTAATRMMGEALKQGVDIDPARVKVPSARLSRVATARAALAGQYLAQQAGTKALQTVRAASDPALDAADSGDTVDVFLGGLSDTPLKDQLSAALTAAENAGRVSVLEADPSSEGSATYSATELLDDNTCEPCAEIDGEEFGSLSDAEDAYPSGGYIECDGGLRCRGTVVAVWDTSSNVPEPDTTPEPTDGEVLAEFGGQVNVGMAVTDAEIERMAAAVRQIPDDMKAGLEGRIKTFDLKPTLGTLSAPEGDIHPIGWYSGGDRHLAIATRVGRYDDIVKVFAHESLHALDASDKGIIGRYSAKKDWANICEKIRQMSPDKMGSHVIPYPHSYAEIAAGNAEMFSELGAGYLTGTTPGTMYLVDRPLTGPALQLVNGYFEKLLGSGAQGSITASALRRIRATAGDMSGLTCASGIDADGNVVAWWLNADGDVVPDPAMDGEDDG
jgi:hypothetical protein